MRKLTFLAAVAALVLGGIAQAQEPTRIIFREELNGYTGTNDTTIRTGAPDENNDFRNHFENRAFELEWDGSDGGGRNFAMFKFPGIFGSGPNQIPLGSTIVSANLRTFIINNSNRTDRDIVYRLLNDWDEETVTFNNYFTTLDAAAFGSTQSNDPAEALMDNSGLVDVNSKVFGNHIPHLTGAAFFMDITPIAQDWSNGESNYGFMIMVVAGGNGFGHISSEGIFFTKERIDELKAANDPAINSFIADDTFPGFDANLSPQLIVETSAGNFTFQQGENGYEAYEDGYISNRGIDLPPDDGVQHLFTFPLGFEGIIRMDIGADFNELGLLRYGNIIGTGAGQIPPGTTINNARIRFFVTDTADTIDVHEIQPFEGPSDVDSSITVNTDWSEDTATFANLIVDGFFPQFGTEITADSPISTFTPTDNLNFAEADVTSSIQKYANGEPNLGWMLENTAGDDVSFVGKEGAAVFGAPALIIDYLPPAGSAVNEYELY